MTRPRREADQQKSRGGCVVSAGRVIGAEGM